MALVGEVVARFKAETGEYTAKIDAAKAKNAEVAKSFIAMAGSADQAIATLQVAKKSGELGTFGIDPRAVSGIIKEIKSLDQEARKTATGLDDLNAAGRRANGMGDLFDAFERFKSGNFLGAIEKYKKAMADINETGGLNGAFKGAFIATAAVMISKALADATTKAKDLHVQFALGKTSAGELTDQLLRAVPVFGDMYTTADNLLQILTGQAAEMAKQAELGNQIADAAERARKAHAERRALRDELTEEAKEADSKTGISRLRAQGYKGSADMAEIKAAADKELRENLKDIRTKYDAAIAAEEKKRAIAEGAGNADGVDASNGLIDRLRKEREAMEATAMATSGKNFNTAWRDKHGSKTVEQVDAEAQAEAREKAGKAAKEAAEKEAKLDADLTRDANKLLKDREGLDLEKRRVYDLPGVSDVRTGQLFAPPSKVDEKQLEKLGEINQNLKEIKQKAKDAGIVIEEIE